MDFPCGLRDPLSRDFLDGPIVDFTAAFALPSAVVRLMSESRLRRGYV